MKASGLIKLLQDKVNEHGDLDMQIAGSTNSEVITSCLEDEIVVDFSKMDTYNGFDHDHFIITNVPL